MSFLCVKDEFESVDMAYKPLVKKTQTGLGGSASGPPKEGVSQKSGTTGTSEQHAEESAPPVKKVEITLYYMFLGQLFQSCVPNLLVLLCKILA